MNAIGVDIIEIDRIGTAVERWGAHFLEKVYTTDEINAYRKRIPSLASRFAAKEAIMKVLGSGAGEIAWREIEILADASGKPLVRLHGKARKRACEAHFKGFSVSLSDSKRYAIAAALGEK